ncbi:MAG: hypothetical protein HZB73_02515, partial [Nitrosarchaeum sp.]|nr:hypothetical protein [Nitrosarchaeum sp.]
GNGILQDSECGLYDASFVTGSEGTYNVSINAKASGIDTSFGTTFDVLSRYSYDIIRTAQSKIDPTNNPNSFTVRIDIESFTGNEPVAIKEYVPSVFNVVTDAQITVVGNQKVIEWNKNLTDGKTYIEYTYSIPLEFPQLYSLGPIEINNFQEIFYETRPWFVAADPTPEKFGATATSTGTYTNQNSATAVNTDDTTYWGATSGGGRMLAGETGTVTNFGFTTSDIPTGATITNISVRALIDSSIGTNNLLYTLTLQGVTGTCSQTFTLSGTGANT